MGEPANISGEKRDEAGRFIVPPKSPGRPKGARSKLGEAFLEALHEDFQKHGVATIAEVRETKPDQYLKVVASILPKELSADEPTMNVLSELLERIDGKTRVIAPAYERAETVQ